MVLTGPALDSGGSIFEMAEKLALSNMGVASGVFYRYHPGNHSTFKTLLCKLNPNSQDVVMTEVVCLVLFVGEKKKFEPVIKQVFPTLVLLLRCLAKGKIDVAYKDF